MLKIKEEKGSITLIVIVTMLFITILLIGILVSNSNANITSKQATQQIKENYEKDVNDIDQVYQTTFEELNNSYVKDGLILYYSGIDNTGNGYSSTTTNWKDLSGNDNDGILTNFANTTWSNNGLVFNGTTDYVVTNLNPLEELGGSFTISTTMKLTDFSDYRGVWGYHTGEYTGLVLQCNGTQLETVYGNGNQWNRNNLITSDEILNKNISVTVVYEQGVQITTYINGNKIGTIVPTGNISHTETFWIGKGLDNEDRYFEGTINNVLVYNRILSEQEIQDNFEVDMKKGYITEFRYAYTGEEQYFRVPVDGQYKIELWGAGVSMSDNQNLNPSYKYGSYTSGIINLNKNNMLYVYVGQKGEKQMTEKTFNGGGGSTKGIYGSTSRKW